MAWNKDRLLLALYARPKHPETYHYALMTCPKHHQKRFVAQGPTPPMFRKYHVKNTIQSIKGQLVQPWVYESVAASHASEPGLLVFIVIGKVLKPDELETTLEKVPVYQADSDQGLTFDCVEWVRLAVERLWSFGTVTKIAEWNKIREQALNFVVDKKNEGYWNANLGGLWDASVPELDLIKVFDITNRPTLV